MRRPRPKTHHLDNRAENLAAEGQGNTDDLLSTIQVAAWLGVSTQWLEIGRGANYGPPFRRIGPYRIRYLRRDVLEWLETRKHASTAEYNHNAPKARPKRRAKLAGKQAVAP